MGLFYLIIKESTGNYKVYLGFIWHHCFVTENTEYSLGKIKDMKRHNWNSGKFNLMTYVWNLCIVLTLSKIITF